MARVRFVEEPKSVRAAHAGFGGAAILAVASIRFLAAVVAAALSYIDFAADDGLDVALASFIKEIGSSKEIAVIGDGYGGELLSRAFVHNRRAPPTDPISTEFRVNNKKSKSWVAPGTCVRQRSA